MASLMAMHTALVCSRVGKYSTERVSACSRREARDAITEAMDIHAFTVRVDGVDVDRPPSKSMRWISSPKRDFALPNL